MKRRNLHFVFFLLFLPFLFLLQKSHYYRPLNLQLSLQSYTQSHFCLKINRQNTFEKICEPIRFTKNPFTISFQIPEKDWTSLNFQLPKRTSSYEFYQLTLYSQSKFIKSYTGENIIKILDLNKISHLKKTHQKISFRMPSGLEQLTFKPGFILKLKQLQFQHASYNSWLMLAILLLCGYSLFLFLPSKYGQVFKKKIFSFSENFSDKKYFFSILLFTFLVTFGSIFLYHQLFLKDIFSFRISLTLLAPIRWELGIFFSFLILLSFSNRVWSIFLLLISLFFWLIQSLQFLSLFYTRDFLSLDAVNNIDNLHLMINVFNLSILLLPGITLSLFFFALDRKIDFKWLKKLSFIGLFMLLLTILQFSGTSLRASQKKRLLSSYPTPLVEKSPFLSAALLSTNLLGSKVVKNRPQLTAEDLKMAQKYNLIIDTKNPFPLYQKTLPFQGAPFPLKKPFIQPNIIVLFCESLSAKKLNNYGNTMPGLTPNFSQFAQNALVIKNYYNHASPTVRALKGQLLSLYPSFGFEDWAKKKIKMERNLGLPELLNRQGYETLYLNHDEAEVTQLGAQMKHFGFQKLYFKKELLGQVLKEKEPNAKYWGLSDHQMLRAAVKLLQKREKQTKPFFMALSTVETHTGMFVFSKDGVHYPGNPKKIPVLDTTYNLDHAFGELWHYFQKSPLAQNTILIVTADHAHFPSKDYLPIDPQSLFFVDKIALMIYSPLHKFPAMLKANTTSLDFAPSLLHLLGIKNLPNALLGKSMFSSTASAARFAVYEKRIFLINENQFSPQLLTSSTHPDVKHLSKILQYLHYLEQTDQITP